MKNNIFSNKDLKQSLNTYCEAMLDSFPAPSECEHEFSDKTEQKMQVLFKKYKRFEVIENVKRCIAAVIAIIVIGSGLTLTFNIETRAAVIKWVRQIYENGIVYKYYGDRQTDILPNYELQNIPDGFVVMERFKDKNQSFVFYLNAETNDAIVFSYLFSDKSCSLTIQNAELNMNPEKLTLKGYPAEYYCKNDSSDANSLLLFDNKNGIVFHIDSNMDKQVMLDIFNDITLVG